MSWVHVTDADLAAAFTEWERRFREEPEKFISDMERLEESCETYGEECAEYLIELLEGDDSEAQPDALDGQQAS